MISDIQGRPKAITRANSATQEETANGFTKLLITDTQVLNFWPNKEVTLTYVVLGHDTLAFVHLHQNTGLVVQVGRERLLLLGRDRGGLIKLFMTTPAVSMSSEEGVTSSSSKSGTSSDSSPWRMAACNENQQRQYGSSKLHKSHRTYVRSRISNSDIQGRLNVNQTGELSHSWGNRDRYSVWRMFHHFCAWRTWTRDTKMVDFRCRPTFWPSWTRSSFSWTLHSRL